MVKDNIINYYNVEKFLKGTKYEELLLLDMRYESNILFDRCNKNPYVLLMGCTNGWDYNPEHDMKDGFTSFADFVVYSPRFIKGKMGMGFISMSELYADDYSYWIITEILDCEDEFLEWAETQENLVIYDN